MCYKTLELIHRLLEEEKEHADKMLALNRQALKAMRESEDTPQEHIAFMIEEKEKAHNRACTANDALNDFLYHDFI